MVKSLQDRTNALVSAYLSSNGYTAAHEAFLQEAQLIQDLNPPEADLREVVENYLTSVAQQALPKASSVEVEFEKLKGEEIGPLPSKVVRTIRESTNVLSVKAGMLPQRAFDSTSGRFISSQVSVIFAATVDKQIKIYSTPSFDLLDSYSFDSPVLSVALSEQHPRLLIAATMAGDFSIIDLVTRSVLAVHNAHSKYIIRTAFSSDGKYFATAGYDKVVKVFDVVVGEEIEGGNALIDGEEEDLFASQKKITFSEAHNCITRDNPEGLVFAGDSLIYSCRDDNILHYVSMKTWEATGYNLNPTGDNFVSFSILNISMHPTLPLLCLQTSTATARLIFYGLHSATRIFTIYTGAEQSEFATPRHIWTSNGLGVATTSEDGIIRITDLRGKVRVKIGAHGSASTFEEEGAPGEDSTERGIRLRREMNSGSSVIKDVAFFSADGQNYLVSCGFDKTIRISV